MIPVGVNPADGMVRAVVCPDEWHTPVWLRRVGFCDEPWMHRMEPTTRHPKFSTCRNWRPA